MKGDLDPEEIDLVGRWLDNGTPVADPVSIRIAWLVTSRLERVAVAAFGWEALYRDPRDGRLWERTFPHSDWHGGGPPRLRVLSPAAAAAKYGVGTG